VSFIGALAFIVALLLSVMIHEAGHFFTAKSFGMKVTEFFLGFGKKLWSFQRGETEFGVKAIPAGGYCRIVGMSVHEPLTDEEKPRAFYTSSVPKRLIVLGAGSFLHFVLGFFTLLILFSAVGTTAVTGTVGLVPQCLSANGKSCAPTDPISPAFAAGVKAGDQIVAINGVKYHHWSDAVTKIRASAGKALDLTINRAGSTIHISLTPIARTVNGASIGIMGVNNRIGNQRDSFIESFGSAGTLSRQLFTSSISSLMTLPAKVPALIRQTFGREKRDPQGLVGVVGVARVSAQTASDPHLAGREKIATFLLIVASLNIFVGIFNLLPLLPLDGGHMAIAIADGVRRFWAKRRARPAPAPLDVEKLMPVTIAVFVLLVALSLLLLAADIFNPVTL
jgi:membrane-associated protease RseP (regulator of RpoE activity)